MLKHYLWLLVTTCVLVGCAAKEYPPISPEDAKQVKSGTPLAEVVKLLGEPHAPTSHQANALAEVISKMPEAIRTNATKDKSLAWGNDKAFLAAKVNDQDVVWVTTWRSN